MAIQIMQQQLCDFSGMMCEQIPVPLRLRAEKGQRHDSTHVQLAELAFMVVTLGVRATQVSCTIGKLPLM